MHRVTIDVTLFESMLASNILDMRAGRKKIQSVTESGVDKIYFSQSSGFKSPPVRDFKGIGGFPFLRDKVFRNRV